MEKYITGIKAAVAAVVAMMFERDGVRYSEAIDPAELGRTYTETDEAIEAEKQNVPELVYLTIKE